MGTRTLSRLTTCLWIWLILQSTNIVAQPTRNDNILDIFLTKRPTLITRCTTLPYRVDHDIVLIESAAVAKRSKQVKRCINRWRNADIELMKSSCISFQQEFLQKYTNSSDGNTMWERNPINNINSYVLVKMGSSRCSQPCTNRDVKQHYRRPYTKSTQLKELKDMKSFNSNLQVCLQRLCYQYHQPNRILSFIESKKNNSHVLARLKA